MAGMGRAARGMARGAGGEARAAAGGDGLPEYEKTRFRPRLWLGFGPGDSAREGEHD
jgi:hypothetical protein